MSRIKIDINNWSRSREYSFFSQMIDPRFSITSEVCINNCYAKAKSAGKSFFIHYIYAILRTLNEIEQFRYRVVSTEDGGSEVYLYDRVDVTTPIKISEDGRYQEVVIEYTPSFDEFYERAMAAIKSAPKLALSDDAFNLQDENQTLACISSMPFLHFTNFTPCLSNNGCIDDFTLLAVGKSVVREGKSMMPISITTHHGLTDGAHVGKFIDRVQELLDQF